MRATALNAQIANRDAGLLGRAARSGRFTRSMLAPAIRARAAFRYLAVVAHVIPKKVARHGMAGAGRLAWARITGRSETVVDDAAAVPAGLHVPIQATPVRYTNRQVLKPRVLIVAELSIPQCAKYRVWQKVELLDLLGIPTSVADWHRAEHCQSLLQVHSAVIFYRVPAGPELREMLMEARRLGVDLFWEVDDLIFDVELYRQNGNVSTLPRKLQRVLVSGVKRSRQAMLACERAIASTAQLAHHMRECGLSDVSVVENCLDAETLLAAEEARRGRAGRPSSWVTIAYGSGTKTHDADFAVAEGAILELLRTRPQVRLKIFGELTLSGRFDQFRHRVDRQDFLVYPEYLKQLAQCDVSVAPLEATAFNDAKSNIKYLEASVLGLPSVCSPARNFASIIEHGKNGYLATTDQDWLGALTALVDDKTHRDRVGEAALATVTARYDTAQIADQQVLPIFRGSDQRSSKRRLLLVNIFFAPQSFGGATVVAEALARELQARGEFEVYVFTSWGGGGSVEYGLRRYELDGLSVFSVGLPKALDTILSFDNPEMAQIFAQVLDAVEPDVVHFHSLQDLSASIVRCCQTRGLPYLVTVHDAWWLCDRQFMVTEKGSYCGQTAINLSACERCVPDALHLRLRWKILMAELLGARLILSPSQIHRRLYIANGVPDAQIVVHRNGIRKPAPSFRKVPSSIVRFAYIGGVELVKGFHLVRAAFESTRSADYELKIVDNKLNLGLRSINVRNWRVAGKLIVVPAYTQDTLDDFFSQVDVLLFPSQWRESFGLAIVEALARDVWVVASDGIGAAEYIRDGENGTLIRMDNNHVQLSRAIDDLIGRRDELSLFHNEFKADIQTYAEQADELSDLLRECLADAEPGRAPLHAVLA